MVIKLGFNNEKYLEEQRAAIMERAAKFDNKLYLEFGGKLLFDYHASRVLPGFDPNVKMRLLLDLKEQTDIILCIHSGDIEQKKMRADFGITYDADAMKLIDDLKDMGLDNLAVVITRFDDQPGAVRFRKTLERRGVKVYLHRKVNGYPSNIESIVSDEGYGANPYIETTKPLVVVTGPGPGSGKLATCLGQLYHEHKRGMKAGYAKFETFPIWNLPLKHPVNVAYEVATADLMDVNLIDSFHLEAYGKSAVNYNRDVEAFPLVKGILDRIMGGQSPYSSPTDMGVNRAGFGIVDDDAIKEASRQEIIRRYFRYACEYAMGYSRKSTVERAELIMQSVSASSTDRVVVVPARKAAEAAESDGKGHDGFYCGGAIELEDGTIITGKNSSLMHAASALIMNAIKHLAGIPDQIDLLPRIIVESVSTLKRNVMKQKSPNLNLQEMLIALAISATSNPSAQYAMDKLKDLKGCDVHLTHIPTKGDEEGLRRLGVHVTSDPQFATRHLFAG